MTTCIHCGEWFEGGSTGERPVCVKCNSSFAFPPTQPRPTPKPTPVSDPTFDPYYNWLGIPPARQPPNLYQLLGLTELETNQDVIATAADRQSAHLRSFLGGQQALDAERLLAEVEAARVCLLNEHTKSAYDSVLSLAVPSQMPSQFGATPSPAVPVLQLANPASTNAAMPSLLVGPVKSANDHATAPQPSASLPIRRRPAKPQRSPLRQVIQIVLGGIAGCAIGYYLGFVLLPSIRARSAASTPRPPAELVIRQSPIRPSNQSPSRRQATEREPSPTATPPPSRSANSTTKSSSTPRTVPAPTVSRQPPQQPPSVSTSPPPRSAAPATRAPATPPRTLADLTPRSAATPPTSLFPAFVALPKRTTSLSQPLMSIPKTLELKSPRLLTDAAPLQEGEYLYLEELKDAGVRAWTVNAAIPGNAGNDSPREIGEFSERDGELAFRWFSNASAEDEALLLNSLFKFSDDAQQPIVALREPLTVEPLQIDTNERRATQSFGLGAIPRDQQLMLELGSLSGFPSRARFENNVSEVAIGRSASIVFDDVPGAELEVKFQGVSDAGLTIAISPRFRENSASILPMTKSQLETTLQSIQKTIVQTQADIRDGNAALTRLRSQSTSGLNGAQAAGLAGLILKTQSRVRSDQQKLASLQAKLANGPTIRNLLDALHRRPTIAFRIKASAGSEVMLTLVDGGWLSR